MKYLAPADLRRVAYLVDVELPGGIERGEVHVLAHSVLAARRAAIDLMCETHGEVAARSTVHGIRPATTETIRERELAMVATHTASAVEREAYVPAAHNGVEADLMGEGERPEGLQCRSAGVPQCQSAGVPKCRSEGSQAVANG